MSCLLLQLRCVLAAGVRTRIDLCLPAAQHRVLSAAALQRHIAASGGMGAVVRTMRVLAGLPVAAPTVDAKDGKDSDTKQSKSDAKLPAASSEAKTNPMTVLMCLRAAHFCVADELAVEHLLEAGAGEVSFQSSILTTSG